MKKNMTNILLIQGSVKIATGMRYAWKRKERKAQKRYGENK